MRVCEAGKCTGCNSCINICPRGCTSYVTKTTSMKETVIYQKQSKKGKKNFV